MPGPITSSISTGTNHLIKTGQAKMVTSAWDILRIKNEKSKIKNYQSKHASNPEKKIISLLEKQPLTIDEIYQELNEDIVKITQTITQMSLSGQIYDQAGKYYLKDI